MPSGWVADYDTAELRCRETGRELLILYKDTRPGADDSVEKALRNGPAEELIRDYVRCKLFKSYEPDRRYVAQFGVARAPAIVVVHRDGTYHAKAGSMSTAAITSFLATAKAPGASPEINPYIPRHPRYHWHSSLEDAGLATRQSNRPTLGSSTTLIVFYRLLSRDWQMLNKLLTRREAYSRLADMVHCRIGIANPWTDAYITRFGALKLPAIVIAFRDGTHDVLELPTTSEAIARFVDAAQQRLAAPQAQQLVNQPAGAGGQQPASR